MIILLEFEGLLFNTRAACWRAYRHAVAQIGLACTDEPTFWRLHRKGAGDEQLVKGAKPHQLDAFRKHFDAACDAEDVIEQYEWQDDTDALWQSLGRHSIAALITVGRNVTARQHKLAKSPSARSLNTSGENPITPLGRPQPVGAAQLKGLVGAGPACVFASSDIVVRTAEEAGLHVIGVADGACALKRLDNAGARTTYPTVTALLGAIQNRDELLVQLGLTTPQSSEVAPPVDPTIVERDRLRGREARRQARIARRNQPRRKG